jgi:serine/threonine protein kinase/WD40 repeat protein/tetratricopeptide (TPR) repeat protein
MNDDQGKAKTIFQQAAEIASADQRQGYVAEACGVDQALRLEVEGLLRHHDRLGSFLEPAAGDPVTTDEPTANERPGTVIGPYKLLQQIGEGGMGAVFMAEQTQPVRRMVALKVIKAGMDSAQVIARFEAERQALAMMDHVNIARVLDAGATESGRPYFVMELVHGVPITKYCDDNQLTPRERLELFVPVCQAIQHAHQKGVIHRDIKPSNVMVTLYDGKPVPKVIDFGIAKATEQKLTERTLFTQYGAMVGTLEYMSPEQAEMSALGVDTRSDVYSLGVLLYELLTGSTPLTRKRFKEAAYGEILRIIKEEEPPKPSTRLSDSGAALASISAQRKTEPAKLSKLMRGELDWIVMKTLEKDRNRRYETASGFAADLKRYLNDETVLACPPSVGYRLRKFVRRNRGRVVAASLVVLALVGGIVGTTWGMLRATEAEADARAETVEKDKARAKTAEERDHAENAEQAERASKFEAMNKLCGSYRDRAKAGRLSRQLGQRFASLKAIEDAVRIARELNLPMERFDELRNEAIACLALPDLRVAKEWDGWPTGTWSVDFAGTLERYARVDRQGAVSVRRVADDIEIYRLPGMGSGESWPMFSPDGQFLVQSRGNLFQLWKLAGQKPVLIVERPMGTFAFSPDSRQFAQALPDGSLCMYDLPSGRQTKQLQADPGPHRLAFHPKDQQLAISYANCVQIRDLETGRLVAELAQPAVADCLAWRPDGKTLAVAGGDRSIHIWDVATRKQIAQLEGHKSAGITFAFSHAGDLLASACWDGMLRLWEPRTGQQLFQTQTWATCLRFSPDDHLLAAGVDGDKLRLWEVASACGYRTLVRDQLVGKGEYFTSAIHPEGRLLAVGMKDGTDFWDLASGNHLASIKLALNNLHVLFEPSGALLTNGPDGLRRWPVQADPASAELLRVGPPQKLPVPGSDCAIARSLDGRVLASAQHDGGLVLRGDLPDKLVRLGPHEDVRNIAVSRDGRLVATGSWIGTKVKVWQAQSGKLEKELPVETGSMVGFSPDGKWLMTTGGGCRLWEVDGWQPSPLIGGSSASAFAFSPDSKLLAVETGYVVLLVDPDTGRELARLEDPNQDRAVGMCFTPVGTQLVTTNNDSHSVHVWDLRTIRRQLVTMDLDWGQPTYPPAEEKKDQPPLQVTVNLGALAPETPQRAVVKYSLALAFMPLNPEAYLRRGRANYQLKQWREAADDLDVALALNPGIDDGQVCFELGRACSEAGRSKPAIAAYSRAIELNPQSHGAWNNRGLLREQLGELDNAVEDFSKAIELNAKDDIPWINRSRVYAQLGRWEKVVEDCSRALEHVQGPGQVEAYYRRAGAYTQLARYREGVADYEKVLELAPNSSLAHNDLAWLLANCPDAKLRDPVRAAQLAQQAIDLAEQVGNVWNTLGVAHYRAAEWKAAIEALNKSIDLRKGGDAFDFYILAMAHWQLGHKDEAHKWHDKAVQWMQENEEALKKDKMHAEELRRFRAEAEELLKIEKKTVPE